MQQKDLTLEAAITKCQAQEAAKRQRAEMARDASESISAIWKTQPKEKVQTCPGCGAGYHPGGRRSCPAYKETCHTCQSVGHFAKVCYQRPDHQTIIQPHPSTRAIRVKPVGETRPPWAHLSNIRATHITEPALTIPIHITSLNGAANLDSLPDSGADISAAGTQALRELGEHVDNLLPSRIVPRAVNGTKMKPIRKLPVTFQLGTTKHKDELHIYPEVTGVLLSWKAAKGLNILTECYPHPINTTVATPKKC